MERKLKLAILTGQDSAATCQTVSMLADLPEVEIVSILADVEPLPLKSRLRNLRRNIRREGIGYVWYRLFDFVREAEERLAQRLVSQEKISKVLQESFPERPRCLADLGRQRNIPILHVGNLNRAEAAKALRELDSDLGIVLGTRILKRSTFAVPRMGCINLHKGKVPEYRGMPPGFWELYDSQNSATVTVHMVDDHFTKEAGQDWQRGTVSVRGSMGARENRAAATTLVNSQGPDISNSPPASRIGRKARNQL